MESGLKMLHEALVISRTEYMSLVGGHAILIKLRVTYIIILVLKLEHHVGQTVQESNNDHNLVKITSKTYYQAQAKRQKSELRGHPCLRGEKSDLSPQRKSGPLIYQKLQYLYPFRTWSLLRLKSLAMKQVFKLCYCYTQ